MDYFLDTNIIIYALKGTFEKIESYMKEIPAKNIKIPSIVKAELLFGAEKSQYKKKVLNSVNLFLEPFEIVDFNEGSCEVYAKIRFNLEKKGQQIGPNDLIIASIVKSNDGVLITHNTKEFSRIKGLKHKDWCL